MLVHSLYLFLLFNWTLGFGCWILDAGYWMLDSGNNVVKNTPAAGVTTGVIFHQASKFINCYPNFS
jgi:hypothetical protein